MRKILIACEYCSCVTVFILAALTTIDAVGRYAFNSPIGGATEISELLLVTLISLSFPVLTACGEHVDVDILILRLTPFIKRVIFTISSFIGTILFGIITVLGVMRALEAFHSGQITNVLRIPVYPFLFLFAFACLMTVFALMVRVANLFRGKMPDMDVSLDMDKHAIE